jgi:Bacterial lipid A biosynthesis acyltransferase
MNAAALAEESHRIAAQHRAAVQRDLQRIAAHAGGEDRLVNAYHMADANLRHFFPQLPAPAIAGLIGEVLFQQRMALHDQRRFGLIEHTRLIDDAGVLAAPRQARIYCTYHAGSYRHLLHMLAWRGIDCLLFVAARTRGLQGDSFVEDAAEGARVAGWRGRLDLLDADTPHSLLQAVRALKRGGSVVIYVDGHSGAGRDRDKDVAVPFFGRTLQVRGGAAYLSHLSQAPIVPVVCRRGADHGLNLHFHTPLTPAGSERAEFAATAMRTVYQRLEQAISADPGQWEGWLYAHKYLLRESLDAAVAEPAPAAGAARWSADQQRFALLRFGTQAVLLDKARHSCSLLDETLAGLFQAASNGGTVALDGQAPPLSLLASGALRPAVGVAA